LRSYLDEIGEEKGPPQNTPPLQPIVQQNSPPPPALSTIRLTDLDAMSDSAYSYTSSTSSIDQLLPSRSSSDGNKGKPPYPDHGYQNVRMEEYGNATRSSSAHSRMQSHTATPHCAAHSSLPDDVDASIRKSRNLELQGRHKDAHPLLKNAFEQIKKYYGSQDLCTLNAAQDVARNFVQQGKKKPRLHVV